MPKRALVYLAAPVRPVDGETLMGNLAAAELWLRQLMESDLDFDVICPWLAELRAWGQDLELAEAVQREQAMARNLRIASRCDGILMVGPRVSSGMAQERDAVLESGGFVRDHTGRTFAAFRSLLPCVTGVPRSDADIVRDVIDAVKEQPLGSGLW